MNLSPALQQRLRRLGIAATDLEEQFILGTGSGGQKINKTASCVLLKHLPSGRQIRCQSSRNRETNRITAREELCAFLESQKQTLHQAKRDEREKKRRQTRQRSRAQKARMLDDKSKRSQKKSNRRNVRDF